MLKVQSAKRSPHRAALVFLNKAKIHNSVLKYTGTESLYEISPIIIVLFRLKIKTSGIFVSMTFILVTVLIKR